MADNLLYEVQYYGKIPNANRTYYLTRSQPPFLTSIIRAVYESGAVDKHWLASALKIALDRISKRLAWQRPACENRPIRIEPLLRQRSGPCPEVEPGHYDEKIQPWLAPGETGQSGLPLTPFRFLNEYLYCGKYADLKVDGLTLDAVFQT